MSVRHTLILRWRLWIHITEIQWVASGVFPPQEQLENEGFSCLMLTFILQYKLWLLIDGSDSHVFILSIF